MVLALVQDWASSAAPGWGPPRIPSQGSSGGCPGFIYPLGPGTLIRTDHTAQQPSAAAFQLDGSALRRRSVVHALVLRCDLREGVEDVECRAL